MNRTSKNYFFISLIFLLTAVGLWTYFIFFVHTLDSSAVAFETKASEAYAQKSQLASTEHLVQDIATSTEVLYSAFVPSSDIASVVDAIESQAASYSVTVKVQSIASASSTDPAILKLDMDIDAAGSWSDLVAFSGGIERMPYALALTKTSFFYTAANAKNPWSMSAHVTSFLSP